MSNLDAGNEPIALEIVIGDRLKQLAPRSGSCCIYRVPKRLRCINPKAYTPKIVSIGPFHHGQKELEEMEEDKYRYLNDYLVRTQVSLESYIAIVRSHEGKLRSYYDENIKYNSDDFIKIILLDSAFIIELSIKWHLEDGANEFQRIQTTGPDISSDLLLLENQVPFFILEALFDPDRVDYGKRKKLSLIQLHLQLFSFLLEDVGVDPKSCQVEGEHFLDMVRSLCLPPGISDGKYSNPTEIVSAPSISEQLGACISDGENSNPTEFVSAPSELLGAGISDGENSNSTEFVSAPSELLGAGISDGENSNPTKVVSAPSISELHGAGVKLKLASDRNLFAIKFENGVLEIPRIEITDGLEPLLRNMAAFEQCHYRYKRIADYLVLWDSFVNTADDAELLIGRKIVSNLLGDNDEVSSMINNLGKGINLYPDDFYFGKLCEDLHEHCNKPWNKWKANLRQSYLNTPWAILSIIAAAFLIILTVIQTVCSLISLKS